MDKRFKKNICPPLIEVQDQEKLENSSILICGAGGIGSNLITNLLSIGVKNIGIIEKDNVDITNLNRQIIYTVADVGTSKALCAKRWANNYSPDCKVKIFDFALTENNWHEVDFDSYDIIVDCFDNKPSVSLLHKIAVQKDLPLITGGANASNFYVMTVFPKKTDCLGCFGLLEEPKVKKEIGILCPTCATMAAAYAFEIIKIITKKGAPITNGPLFFSGMNFKTLKPKTSTTQGKCPICGRQMKKIEGISR